MGFFAIKLNRREYDGRKTKINEPDKQLLLLYQQGKGKKTIAKVLGMSKTTVKMYLHKLESLISEAD